MTDARTDWERRIYRRLTETTEADAASELPAPSGLATAPGNGFVRLEWEPVAGRPATSWSAAATATSPRSSPTATATSLRWSTPRSPTPGSRTA